MRTGEHVACSPAPHTHGHILLFQKRARKPDYYVKPINFQMPIQIFQTLGAPKGSADRIVACRLPVYISDKSLLNVFHVYPNYSSCGDKPSSNTGLVSANLGLLGGI